MKAIQITILGIALSLGIAISANAGAPASGAASLQGCHFMGDCYAAQPCDWPGCYANLQKNRILN